MSQLEEKISQLVTEYKWYLERSPWNNIPEVLENIDALIKDTISKSKNEFLQQRYKSNREKVEKKILWTYAWYPYSISEILAQLSQVVYQILLRPPEEIDNVFWILTINIDWVILPPGNIAPKFWTGSWHVKNIPDLQKSRYGEVLWLLRQWWIYANDIIVYSWKISKSQMRSTSYRVIQIPKISTTIFVCDEYWEATFVVKNLVYPEIFLEKSKLDIREKLDAIKISHVKNWEQKFSLSIFWNEALAYSTKEVKVDVRLVHAMREEIVKLCPTAESWMKLTKEEKTKLKISWYWLNAVARFFWVEWSPTSSSKVTAQIWEKIYWVWHEYIECEFWDTTLWQAKILETIPTPQQWMNMNRKEKKTFKILGKWPNALSRIFGFEENPVNSIKSWAKFWVIIYWEGHLCIDEVIENTDSEETKSWNIEYWKKEIKNVCPNATDWMKLNAKEKWALKVKWKWLHSLCTLFWVDGNAKGNSIDMARLWKVIYWDWHDCIEQVINQPEDETLKWTVERWKSEITRLYPTAKDWMNLKVKEKSQLRFFWKSLYIIGKILLKLDITNPVWNSKDMAKIGQLIYWEWHECIEQVLNACDDETLEWSQEEWKSEITGFFPEPKKLVELSFDEKNALRIRWKSLRTLSTIFWVSWEPANTFTVLFDFLKIIYWEDHPFLLKIDAQLKVNSWNSDRWKKEIIMLYPNPESLLWMSFDEKNTLRIYWKSLRSLTSIFWIKWDPANTFVVLFDLLKKIYGNTHSSLVKVESSLESNNWDINKWKTEITHLYPNPETLLKLTTVEKKLFRIHWKSLRSIAKVFSIEEDPVNSSFILAKLLIKIYGKWYTCIEEVIEKEIAWKWSKEKWREEIQQILPTKEQWNTLTWKQRKDFKIKWHWLTTICTIFWATWNPISETNSFLALWEIIYGEKR